MPIHTRYQTVYTVEPDTQALSLGDGDSLDNDLALNVSDNYLVLRVTASEYLKLLSSVYNGARTTYPQEYLQVIYPLLKAAKTPVNVETGNCFAYPPYAPFISYTPMNPYNNPNEVPNDYLVPPFYIYDGGGSLPPVYNAGDIITPFSAINLNPFDLFTGNLPTVQIQVMGSGQVEIDLLSIGNGGLCAVSLNESPSLLDVLSGVFSAGTIVIDTNLDSASLPAEDDVSIQHEIDIIADTPEEINTIFLTFMPVIDDSLFTPLRFGGGLRSVQLCGFESVGQIMGITDIRLTGCNIEAFQDGVWSTVVNINDCVSPQITALQSDIDANTSAIATNTGLIADNVAAITANANNITTLRNDVDQIIDVDLPQIALTTTSLQNQITANDTELSDHESRITVLENLGTSGEHLTKTVRIEETIEYIEIEVPTILSAIDMPVPEGYYDELRIDFAIKADVNGFNKMRMYINQNYTATDYYDEREGVEENLNNITQFYHNDVTTENYHTGSIYIKNPSKNTKQTAWSEGTSIRGFTNSNTIDYQWYYDFTAIINEIRLDLANGNFIYNSWVRLVGIKETEILLPAPLTPTQGLITFDSGGYAYTLPPSQVGTVQSGGNPDNRLYAASVALNDVVSVELDMLSTQTLSEVSFDYIAPTFGLKEWRIYLDGQLKADLQFSGNISTWTSEQVFLGFSGRIVRVELAALAPNQSLGLDNIFVDWL